jgi:hypothetical protein
MPRRSRSRRASTHNHTHTYNNDIELGDLSHGTFTTDRTYAALHRAQVETMSGRQQPARRREYPPWPDNDADPRIWTAVWIGVVIVDAVLVGLIIWGLTLQPSEGRET